MKSLSFIGVLLVLMLLNGCDTQEPDASTNQSTNTENYTFTITGDFDGDGNIDTLMERYVSTIDGSTLPKAIEGKEYDTLVALTTQTQPICLLIDPANRFDTLEISNVNQQFGLAYLKNEGDLNGDGTDEISFAVDWADWSNTNTYYIYSYINGKWEKVYSFSILDSQLPDYTSTASMDAFKGLVEKVDNDTIIIDARDVRDVSRKKVWDLNFPK